MTDDLRVQRRPQRFTKRSIAMLAGVVVVAAAVAGLGGWAASSVLRPQTANLEVEDFATATITSGTVGSTLSLNTSARWSPTSTGINGAAGTVTTVGVEDGAYVSEGQVLYSVDLEPVVAAQGSIPSFRDIGNGSEGEDVVQLQSFLSRLGFYSAKADGKAASKTIAAIRAWQKSIGVEETGVMTHGSILYLPVLPTRVIVDSEIVSVGSSLAGGEKAVQSYGTSPEFFLAVSDAQAAEITAGTRVEISGPNKVWQARTSSQETDPDIGVIISLIGQDSESICAPDCADVPIDSDSEFSSTAYIVEESTGLTAPTSALKSDANGNAVLVDVDGGEHAVTVLATARGIALIEGVEAGLVVRLSKSDESE
jgi:peptidoglycan hydrolase-like protein with peptidoglycan-binding domain